MKVTCCVLSIILAMTFSVYAQDAYLDTYVPSYAIDRYVQSSTLHFQKNEFPLDKINVQDWSATQQSQSLFYVRIEKNELVVSQNTYRTQEIALAFNNGILYGINDEHQGGRLVFVAHGNYQNPYTIKQGNTIKSIFVLNNKIYFYEVLLADKRNNQVSNGALYELTECDDGFFYREVYRFKSAPYYIASIGESIVVLTYDALYELTAEGMWIRLINNAPWSISGPTSFSVYDKENIFIGLRGGYLKVDIVHSKCTFYRYIE